MAPVPAPTSGIPLSTREPPQMLQRLLFAARRAAVTAATIALAASAWTRDTYRAGRATREIRAGCVWVNDHIPILSEMPHGGFRHSGFGKDMSAYSFDEYTNVKHVMHDNTAVAHKPWHRTIFTLPG